MSQDTIEKSIEMPKEKPESNSSGLLLSLGAVLHALQKERGCVSLYLGSEGKTFAKDLFRQQQITIDAITDAMRAMEHYENNNARTGYIASLFADLKHRLLDTLPAIQKDVLSFNKRHTPVINTYTFELNLPVLNVIVAIAHDDPNHNSVLVSAFSKFLQWKERVGRERALGSRGFYSSAFLNEEFCDHMLALMSEEESYLKSFINIASPTQIELIKDILSGPEMAAIKNLHRLIESGDKLDQLEKYTSSAWFEMMTNLIDALFEKEKLLIDGLSGKMAATPESLPVVTASSKNIDMQPYLRNLSVFAGLSDAEINELLGFAQIRNYNKGKLLFLQNEPASRLYIIISGWVKIYNGLDSGEETILQMLSAGDTLLESAIFLDTPTQVNAQIVEDSVILSIPAPVIRQRIQHNNRLAVSMLNNVSLRSQMLIYQIEQSRLKSAKERVGWFLLRLKLTQGGDKKVIHLPYDKAIIASYLNMRPETFSRSLKRLRDDGFTVLNDSVEAPDAASLCGYCDGVLAATCPRAKTTDCSIPEFAASDFS